MLPYSSSIAAPPLLVVVDLDRNVVAAVAVDLFMLFDIADFAAIVAADVDSGEMRCCCCLERI